MLQDNNDGADNQINKMLLHNLGLTLLVCMSGCWEDSLDRQAGAPDKNEVLLNRTVSLDTVYIETNSYTVTAAILNSLTIEFIGTYEWSDNNSPNTWNSIVNPKIQIQCRCIDYPSGTCKILNIGSGPNKTSCQIDDCEGNCSLRVSIYAQGVYLTTIPNGITVR